MWRQLNESQAARVRNAYREHPLYVACQYAFSPLSARMDEPTVSVEDVFCKSVCLFDDLLTEPVFTQQGVDMIWAEMLTDVRRMGKDGTRQDGTAVVASVFSVVSSALCLHWTSYYSDTLRELLLSTLEREGKDVEADEMRKLLVRLSQSTEALSVWVNAYTDEEGLLSDEIERIIYQHTDMDNKEIILETLSRNGISISGDLIVGDKVQNKVEKVENGGIGIQIVNGQERTPLTVSDKDIKAAIMELLKTNEDTDQPLFRNKKQWWAVYRVLYSYCNYPAQMTSFEAKMKELEVAKVDGKRDLSYESLSAAAKEVPMMATCKPDAWHTLKDKSDNYLQQYVVAEFLMQKLGIKS